MTNYSGHTARAVAALTLCAGCCLAVAGCALWRSDPPARGAQLPRPRLAPDSVILEAALVRFPPPRDNQLESVWAEVEEPSELEMRRRLDANGFWCGLCGIQLPSELREQLDTPPSSDLPAPLTRPAEAQRLQCRSGQRKVIRCRGPEPELHALVQTNNSLSGQTFLQATASIAVRCYPQPDGAVRVQLTPEVEHGETKPRHQGGEGGMWQVRVGQELREYEQLAAEATLSPGQTLLLSCTPDRRGLGGSFFATDEGRSVLLIRLAQTQQDPLFAPDAITAPITNLREN